MPTIHPVTKPSAHRPLPFHLASGMSPAWLDRLADFELQQGHLDAAEQLAQRAAEMRGAAQ